MIIIMWNILMIILMCNNININNDNIIMKWK